jgi:hypothetical protein
MSNLFRVKKIYNCINSACNHKFHHTSKMVWNTLDEEIYSDMKVTNPAYEHPPLATKCPTCKQIAWIKDILANQQIGTYRVTRNFSEIQDLTIQDCVEFLTDINYVETTKEFIDLRFYMIELFNNRIRYEDYSTTKKSGDLTLFSDLDKKKLWKTNLKALSKLLDLKDNEHKCLKAEILRYKGKFKKAKKMLKKIKHPDYTWYVNQSIQKCKEKNDRVFKLVKVE